MSIDIEPAQNKVGVHPLLPLRNQLVFPGHTETVPVVRPESLAALASLEPGEGSVVALFLQRDVGTALPAPHDLHEIGVLAKILSTRRHAELGVELVVMGLHRVRRTAVVRKQGFLVATVEPAHEAPGDAEPTAIDAIDELRSIADRLGMGTDFAPKSPTEDASTCASAGELADHLAARVHASSAERADILAALDPAVRVARTLALLRRELACQAEIQELGLPTVDELEQLWVLRDGAAGIIEQRVADGELSATEAEQLLSFRERGFVIWEGLIDADAIDRYLQDVENIRAHPGRYLLTDARRSRPFRASGPDFDEFESVFDTHVNLESARRLCFHPTLLRFLGLLFGERPMATQQLLFQRSNGHQLHQDTAYVCMREPLLMTATWIALEDVVQGRGELTYFEASHLIPHYRFAGDSKRYQPELDDEDAAREELLRRSEALGCRQRAFLAKKGDVFLWAADLLHGSNPRTRPEEETRRSLVTHYCPESNQPLYFFRGAQHRGIDTWNDHALIASSHYRLPIDEHPAQPDFPLPEPC